MAKKALLDVLEQTIGKYVKNLDAETLNVAVWSGKIQLNSLSLDIDAVNQELDRQAAEAPNLAVPFKVVSGTFESFEVDVPWAHLMSQSVVLRARGLQVAVEPYDRASNADHLHAVVASESIRAKKTQNARIHMLKSSNEYRERTNAMRKIALSSVDDEGSKKDSSSFGSRLVRRIIENLQIEVGDVHVSLRDMDGSAGVVLKSISLITTDVLGKKSFVDRTNAANAGSLQNSFLYKQLRIDGFGVYLDDKLSSSSSPSRRLLSSISENDGDGATGENAQTRDPSHRYILKPLSFQAKLRQADGNICLDYHKYLLSSELSSIDIDLSRDQMDIARNIILKLQPSVTGKTPLFPEYRPLSRVTKASAKEWWMYAGRCIGRLNGRRSWIEFFRAFKLRKQYIPLYKRHAHSKACSWIQPLKDEETKQMEEIELDRSISIEGIMVWRTIADAQMEKEKEKHQSKKPAAGEQQGFFGSIFGSGQKPNASSQSRSASGEADDPPVTLTVEELKELEAAERQSLEDDLSQDSKLCDLKFVLQSLQVNLFAYNLNKLVSFELGSVSTSFSANMDGAFKFLFNISDLEVKDHATLHTLYPSIVRKTSYKQESVVSSKDAFIFQAEKSHNGDQKLTAKLAAFETIASPALVKEIYAFFLSSPAAAASSSQVRQNPLLAQSLSGSVDLFFDASQGTAEQVRSIGGGAFGDILPEKVAEKPNDEWKSSLIEAWQQKTAKKSSLIIDIDIMAPVLVVPESCADPSSSILVVDLGRLRLKYGKIDPPANVVDWFNKNRAFPSHEVVLDGGSLDISDLKFFADTSRNYQSYAESGGSESSSHILQPISMHLDVGVESHIGNSPPQICAFGVIPAIRVGLSPNTGSHVMSVANPWMALVSDVTSNNHDSKEGSSIVENRSDDTPAATTPVSSEEQGSKKSLFDLEGTNFALLHVGLELEELAATILDSANKPQLEAKLMSARASLTTFSEGSMESRVRMGYFWVLDRLTGDYVRKQRLVAHSSLPATDLANHATVMSSLEQIKAETAGDGTELADISFTSKMVKDDQSNKQHQQNELRAKFTQLYIHWNPSAMKHLVLALDDFQQILIKPEANSGAVIVPPSSTIRRSSGNESAIAVSPSSASSSSTTLRVIAEMESFNIHLNSAIDDLPLFVLSLGNTKMKFESHRDGLDTRLGLQVGALAVATNNLGSTRSEYETLLGLLPGDSNAIVDVKYYTGSMIPKNKNANQLIGDDPECLAEVSISPVQMVYIQSQVLALTEYITEGILGAITAQAASSATEAAKELTAQGAKDKVFMVYTKSFDILLPESATTAEYLSIEVGSVSVCHKILPVPNGATSQIRLENVALKDKANNMLQEAHIHANVAIVLPDGTVGDLNDQAMRIIVDISNAKFKLSKPQYQQIMSTVAKNFGCQELYLREAALGIDQLTQVDGDSGVPSQQGSDKNISHAGVEVVEKMQRMVLTAQIKELSIWLMAENCSDGLVSLAAVETQIKVWQYPDLNKQCVELALSNLICEDQRKVAANREFRYLMRQPELSSATKSRNENAGTTNKDLFRLKFTSETGSSDIELFVGTPQMTLIPDAISEILEFVKLPEPPQEDGWDDGAALGNRTVLENSPDPDRKQLSRKTDGTSVAAIGDDVPSLMINHTKIQTRECSILLVDLGSQLHNGGDEKNRAEIIAVQGIFMCNLSTTTDLHTNKQTDAQVEVNGDSVQVYTAFGQELGNPTQILDPIGYSAHVAMETTPAGMPQIEVRLATLSHIDVVFSMHDAALLTSILSSLQRVAQTPEEDESTIGQSRNQKFTLDPSQTRRIENLAEALERGADDDDQSHSEGISVGQSSESGTQTQQPETGAAKYILKMTVSSARVTLVNDLQGLDEALVRLATNNFVTQADVLMNEPLANSVASGPLFEAQLNSSFLADYYDSSTGRWENLLVKPWEVSLKTTRSPKGRIKSNRLNTVVDLESFPCRLSLSDQFLVSIAGANQMWTIYSSLINDPADDDPRQPSPQLMDGDLRRSIVSSMARNLVTSLPYGIDNRSGLDLNFVISGSRSQNQSCSNGRLYYFRYDPPKSPGIGGKRQYGQDVSFKKSLNINIAGQEIEILDIDKRLGSSWTSHELKDSITLFSKVEKLGKTTLLRISSCVEIKNTTLIPFQIAIQNEDGSRESIGTCQERNVTTKKKNGQSSTHTSISACDPITASPFFSIPAVLLSEFSNVHSTGREMSKTIEISPVIDGSSNLTGRLEVSTCLRKLRASKEDSTSAIFDIICRPSKIGNDKRSQNHGDPFVVQALLTYTLVDNKYISICAELLPRGVLQNRLPIKVNLRTPMPHTYLCRKESAADATAQTGGKVVSLEQDDYIEIFTPGPSIAITAKPTDTPIGGTSLDWMDGGWIDLPLVSAFQLPEPLGCVFPFATSYREQTPSQHAVGNDFFIVEGSDMLRNLSSMCSTEKFQKEDSGNAKPAGAPRSVHAFFITVCTYAVDHTGDLLFEHVDESTLKSRRSFATKNRRSSIKDNNAAKPFGAFTSERSKHRLSMLPNIQSSMLRMLQLTMDQDEGMKRSLPFRIDDAPIGNGGVDSLPIVWEDETASGYFAYRKLIDEHQSELHFIPEFFVFNGSSSVLLVHEANLPETIVEVGKALPLRVVSRPDGIQLAFNFIELGCCTAFLQFTGLGMKVAILKSRQGHPIGSVAVQTAIDTLGNSCLVVKVGEVKFGSKLLQDIDAEDNASLVKNDFVRYRVRWTELAITLKKKKVKEESAAESSATENFFRFPKLARSTPDPVPAVSGVEVGQDEPVVTVLLNRFTVDYQRIFDERPNTSKANRERTQISLIAHDIQIKDENPHSAFPIVVGCSQKVSFLDLCIRARGPLDADMVRVDLFDLNLAHLNGSTEKIVVNTDEEFVWKLVDVIGQIANASNELGDVQWRLEEDEQTGGYSIQIEHSDGASSSAYTPPQADKLYSIAHTRVSPFTVLLSFKRNPQAARYRGSQNSQGAALVKYFTERLKFTIDKAELKFARYSDHTLKGPTDRILESLMAVYASRMKFKVLRLLTATSIQDWKYLASRDSGDDEYVHGDILRATGHLSGKTVGYVFKKAGTTIGDGISGVSRAIGSGIESSTQQVGAGSLGAGVNKVVSGVGDGVGSTVAGVGNGFGMALKGSGQGLGQVIGGISGGVMMAGKGIGKGITAGDGKAMVKGITQGGKSIGNGVGQGVESVIMGTADGVMSAGKGVIPGKKNKK